MFQDLPWTPVAPVAYAAHLARRGGAASAQPRPGGADVHVAVVEAQLTLQVEKMKTWPIGKPWENDGFSWNFMGYTFW